MKKYVLPAVLLAITLCGCGQVETTPEPTPQPTQCPYVDIGGTQLSRDAEIIDLRTAEYDLETLVESRLEFENVKRVELGPINAPEETVITLRRAFPKAEVSYAVNICGRTVSRDVETLDLSHTTLADTQKIIDTLPYFNNLKEINFVDRDGNSVYGVNHTDRLTKIQEAAPNAHLKLKFDLFGQTISTEDEEIIYDRVPIGNHGAELVRHVLPFLKNCNRFVMDGCDIDYEILAQMRDDFPDTKIVWRIWFIKPNYYNPSFVRNCSLLTDDYRVRTVWVNDSNSYLLNYCNEAKYLDVGHVFGLSDISFVENMPDLEVAILALTGVSDITPLKYCEKLEYLEVCKSPVTDISVLENCKNLKHLNIGWTGINDLSPIEDLDLERLWVIGTATSWSDIVEYGQRHPNTTVQQYGGSPFQHGWRWNEEFTVIAPRYKLLREQMEYDIDAAYGIP